MSKVEAMNSKIIDILFEKQRSVKICSRRESFWMFPLTNTSSNIWGIYCTPIFGNWNNSYRRWTAVIKKRDGIHISRFLDSRVDLIKFRQSMLHIPNSYTCIRLTILVNFTFLILKSYICNEDILHKLEKWG